MVAHVVTLVTAPCQLNVDSLDILRFTVMRLVHDSKYGPRVALIFGGKLAPEIGELSVGRSSLADYCSIPACIYEITLATGNFL